MSDDPAGGRPSSHLHSPVLPELDGSVSIGGRVVGAGAPYVIAEAGSNHDGDLAKALALVDVAAAAGCDAVKFQTFSGPDIGAGEGCEASRLPAEYHQWGSTLEELYRRCALPREHHAPIAERAAERGVAFFASAFSEWAVDFLVDLGVAAIKIASFELVHLPLIRHAAASGLPLILSTGMAGLGDIERGLEAVAAGGGREVVLLHCGSNYPLGAASANLAAMETMRRAFSVPVGYSDHTTGIAVSTAAAALGAAAIEKHFTLEERGDGPDHSFSLLPAELTAMVAAVREASLAIGSPRKHRQAEEEDHARRGRRSLFAAQDLREGDILETSAVDVLRPGVGLEPLLLPTLLGRTLRKSVRRGEPLTWDHFLS